MSSTASSSSSEEVRSRIVRSLFSRKAEDGALEETLVAHLRIKEDDHGNIKSRYLMLAVTRLGECVLHKGKSNSNGSFSRGKTWRLGDMRVLEQIGPRDFALTMTVRRYHWSTDSAREQHQFLSSVLGAYRSAHGSLPQLINFTPDTLRMPPSTSVPTGPPPPSASSAAPSSSPAPAAAVPSAMRGMPARGTPGMASSGSLASQASDLAPPGAVNGRGERSGSFSSIDQRKGSVASDAGSQGGGYRARVGSSGSRTSERPEVRPAAAPSSSSGRYGDLGSGRPPARRGGSNDERTAPATSTPSRNAAGGRRPSGASEVHIPPVAEADDDDDPYGGMAAPDEVLASPPTRPTVNVEAAPPLPPLAIPQSTPPRAPRRDQSPNTLAPPGATLTEATPRGDGRSTPEPLKRRVSFHPPELNTSYSRDVLLTQRTGLLGADVTSLDEEEAGDAIMANVEELIEGFDWTQSAAASSGLDSTRKAPDAIEQRLLDELQALESANIHAFLESDDRVDQVLNHIDEALLELDDIDMQLTGYRVQLNVVAEDISYIEGQNRGLQVQTSNQRALLEEIQQLLKITDVPKEDLTALTRVSPKSARGVEELEHAAASLYKALMASRDTANEVAASVANVREYQSSSQQFSTRMVQYLDMECKHQSEQTLAEVKKKRNSVVLEPHIELGKALMMYEGLVLFVKDVDEDKYKKLCLNYITTMSKLHQDEMRGLLLTLKGQLNKSNGALPDISFAHAATSSSKPSGISGAVARSRTLRRGPASGPEPKVGDKEATNATRKVADVYSTAVSEVVKQVVTEEDFIAAFLHLGDTESTFADYMQLDTYFRRQAARHASHGLSASLTQLARTVMELMFGFVDGEFRNWIDANLVSNPAAVVGVAATTEMLLRDAQMEGSSLFVTHLFEKQLGRQRQSFDAFVNEQVKVIDEAKASVRKRRGVFFFVRHFPAFVERIECQLSHHDDLEIRTRVNKAYERVVASVLGSLQHVSKIVGAELGAGSGEGKGQLYFHVVMIENLHVFVDEVAQLNVPALAVFVKRARGLYEENMKAYIKMMLRRGFARLMDFFDGVERLLKTTPANEVSMHNQYSRSALKKVLKESGSKDMKKAVEAMARRVDKHFYDDETGGGGVPGGAGAAGAHAPGHGPDAATAALIASVWREITAALRTEVGRATDLISKSYGSTGLSLEYSTRDVDSICQRAHAS